jgi:hypothetical protein
MAGWQVTGRLKTGVAALAGAVVVSMVAPAVAEAAAVEHDPSAPSDPSNRAAADVQAHQKNVPSSPGPADSAAQQSSAPSQSSSSAPSSGFGQAPSSQPTQRKDKPPDRDAHKFSPQQRSTANSPGSASGSGPTSRVGVDRPQDRDPNKVSPQTRTPASPPPDRHDRRDRRGTTSAPPAAVPGRSGANGTAMQQLQAWVPRQPKPKAKTGNHDLAYRYRVINGRRVDPTVQALDEDWEIWGIPVWDRDSFGGKFTSDIFLGLLDGVTGSLDSLLTILNPTQWDELRDEVQQIAQFAQEHPVEFAKQLASWDQWQTDPGRALGSNAFALIPGAGALAKLRTLRRALQSTQTNKGPNGDVTPDPNAAQQPPAQQPPAAPPAQKPEPGPQPAQAPDATPGAQSPGPAPNDGSPTGVPAHSDGDRDTNLVPAPAPRRIDNRIDNRTDNRAENGADNRVDNRADDTDRSAANGTAAKRSLPPAVRQRIEAGNEFNRQMRPRYPHNEVRLGNNKRVDSYVPGREIVERKHTQLAEVRPETAIGYLRMLSNKYPAGQRIANTEGNRGIFANRPDLLGRPIAGRQVLEVPVQKAPVPRSVIDEANARGIIIRDSAGKVYNP